MSYGRQDGQLAGSGGPQYDPAAHQQRLSHPPAAQYLMAAPVAAAGVTQRAAARRPPYPAHLTRFPAGLIPGATRGRRRGVSIWRVIYLGRHPIALLIAMVITAYWWLLIGAWVLAVVCGWALWVAAVTVAWWVPGLFRRQASGVTGR